MTKKLSDLLQAILKSVGIIKDDTINVGKELTQLKAIRERLELAKMQQAESIVEAECNKIDNSVDLREAIHDIEAEYAEKDKAEDAKIEAASEIIKEAEEWLDMFPTKK